MDILFYALGCIVVAGGLGWLFGTFLAIPLVSLISIVIILGVVYVWWKETRPRPGHRGSGAIGGALIGLYFTLCIALGLIVMWVFALRDAATQAKIGDLWQTLRPFLLK